MSPPPSAIVPPTQPCVCFCLLGTCGCCSNCRERLRCEILVAESCAAAEVGFIPGGLARPPQIKEEGGHTDPGRWRKEAALPSRTHRPGRPGRGQTDQQAPDKVEEGVHSESKAHGAAKQTHRPTRPGQGHTDPKKAYTRRKRKG